MWNGCNSLILLELDTRLWHLRFAGRGWTSASGVSAWKLESRDCIRSLRGHRVVACPAAWRIHIEYLPGIRERTRTL